MKRIALLAAAAIAVPVIAAPVAMAGLTATTPSGTTAVPNSNRRVVVQAGATRRVNLGTVNGGTGYAWKWITRPAATIAKGSRVLLATPAKAMPGAPQTAYVRIIGLAEDQQTTGKLGLFAPGNQATPTRTLTLKITVTPDGR